MADKRLIETAFPLRQASAASLHEKNMRHGHISTLHLWPARRPLAASRAAIAAALLPDPGEDEARKTLVRRLGGGLKVKKQTKAEAGKKVDTTKVEGDGGVLWWGQENLPDMAWFRDQIRAAHGGRAPRVLDPFAGGGAIPLEAMRLGCEVVANDINPVAWFILKCTLEYPQRLAGQTMPLPAHAMRDPAFATAFLKSQGLKGARLEQAVTRMTAIGRGETVQDDLLAGADRPWERAGLGWQVRAWGNWVLEEARRELAVRYPTYAEWQSLDPSAPAEPKPLYLLPADTNAKDAVASLNIGLSLTDLRTPKTPRWVAKPTVAYLWARTVHCKHCRANIPLLKTAWLSRKAGKRVRLLVTPTEDKMGVTFAIQSRVPVEGANAVSRKEADRRLGRGTMSAAGVRCPCCDDLMSMEDIRYAAMHGKLGAAMTAVVCDGPHGREYREPTAVEREGADVSTAELDAVFSMLPDGRPSEPISPDRPSPNTRGASGLTRYGIDNWGKLFTPRQLLVLGLLCRAVRNLGAELDRSGYSETWQKAIVSYLALANDRCADYGSVLCSWSNSGEFIRGTFVRFVLSIVWDYAEVNPLSASTGGYVSALEWVAKAVGHACDATRDAPPPTILNASATEIEGDFDAIVTDPPYYDAIPYSDLMDFFHVWLRRAVRGMDEKHDEVFASPLGPKWDRQQADGELVDQPGRFGADGEASRSAYEDGMARVFRACHASLSGGGPLVLVFANKQPLAWGALVASLIRSGFVVDASWPIKTERGARTNAISTASLSSSVWLVCRRRSSTARPGFAAPVLTEMREKIGAQMRRFWDAEIRGPDFVWAATGPALEAFSRHPVVRRETSTTGKPEAMPVSEFLSEVRRLVVEFAVGRVLKPAETGDDDAGGLDEVTTYYVLHRDSFGMGEAPIGACILYALSCGLSDDDLADRFDILARTGGKSDAGDEEEEDDEQDPAEEAPEPETDGTGNKVRLRRWDQRRRNTLGLQGWGGRPVPLIDRVHRLMQLWRAGDVTKVNAFVQDAGLAQNVLFAQLVQALIGLADRNGADDEKRILEIISNHLWSRAGVSAPAQQQLL